MDNNKKIEWLDALRALALALVLVYHLFPGVLPGGFIGVDLFFVCSGYLITAQLVRDTAQTGRLSLPALGRFYAKRLRRLYPALLTAVAAVLALSLLIDADFRSHILPQTAAALGGVTNYYEIAAGQSYENARMPHLLAHTWTLAVELQYYLLWALLIGGLLRLRTRFARLRRRTSGWLPAWTALALAGGCYAAMQWQLPAAPDAPGAGKAIAAAYFATQTHALPLMLGSALGAFAGFRLPGALQALTWRRRFRPVALTLLGVCAAALLPLAYSLRYGGFAAYRWGIPAASLLAAGIVLLLRLLNMGGVPAQPRAVGYLGARSFGVYLYHWPLYIICRQLLRPMRLPPAVAALLPGLLTLTASFLLAELSYRVVEHPLRRGSLRALPARLRGLLRRPEGGTASGRRRMPVPGRLAAACAASMALLAFSLFSVLSAPAQTALERELAQRAGAAEARTAVPTGVAEEVAELAPAETAASTAPTAAGPTPNPRLNPYSVTVIGDSVTLMAEEELKTAIPQAVIDAKVSRDIRKGTEIMTEYEQQGALGDIVVVSLFANNINLKTKQRAEEFLQSVGDRRVVFVTAHGEDEMKPVNDFLRALPAQYPRLTVADWDTAIAPHPEWLYADNTHMKTAAARALYANLIVEAATRGLEAEVKK